jgi:hypothetical protein
VQDKQNEKNGKKLSTAAKLAHLVHHVLVLDERYIILVALHLIKRPWCFSKNLVSRQRRRPADPPPESREGEEGCLFPSLHFSMRTIRGIFGDKGGRVSESLLLLCFENCGFLSHPGEPGIAAACCSCRRRVVFSKGEKREKKSGH